jgi:hypothetical protein
LTLSANIAWLLTLSEKKSVAVELTAVPPCAAAMPGVAAVVF